jgi:hydroxypyruvate reductase
MLLREDADRIIHDSIQKVLPDEAVYTALRQKQFGDGRIYVVAA